MSIFKKLLCFSISFIFVFSVLPVFGTSAEVNLNELEMDHSYEFEVSAGESLYFIFSPKEAVTLDFYSEGSLDVFVRLFNKKSDLEQSEKYKKEHRIAMDDDSGEGTNFRMKYAYEAGVDYFYEVGIYDGFGTVTLIFGEKPQEHIHTYTANVESPPTCVKDGVMRYECECSDFYEEPIPATGTHDFSCEIVGEKYLASAATCNSGAVYYKSCSMCGLAGGKNTFIYGEPDLTKHIYASRTVGPECEKSGYTEYICQVCGNSYSDIIPATGHSWNEGEVIREADCETDGEKVFTCLSCGVTRKDTITAVGHNFGEWVVEADSTCTKPGSRKRVCRNNPAHTQTQEIPINAEAHTWDGGKVTVEATCSAEGEIIYKCIECGWVRKETAEKLQHSFTDRTADEKYLVSQANCSSGAVYFYSCVHCRVAGTESFVYGDPDPNRHSFVSYVTAPTCQKGGYTTYICTCGKSYIGDEVPASDHEFSQWEVFSEPTCTVQGIERSKCENCDEVRFKTLPAKGHSYEEVVIEATCVGGGKTLNTCKNCGDSYVISETDKIQHQYITESAVKATCKAEGIHILKCRFCGDTVTETVPPTGHDYEETTVAPSCTRGGYVLHTCRNCEAEYKTDETSATGHSYRIETEIKPSCENPGVRILKCINCGHVKTDTVEKTGHSYEETVVAPNCTQGGYVLHTCKNCGKTYKTDESKAVGHTYEEEILEEAGCTEAGIKKIYCMRCGFEYNTVISAVGHSLGQWGEIIKPNCESPGAEAAICSVCGESAVRIIEALGHSFVSQRIEPTCTENGYTKYTCSRCEKTYTADETEALGHIIETLSPIEPTCTADGKSEGKICRLCGEVIVEQQIIKATGHKYIVRVVKRATCTESGERLYRCDCGDEFTDTEEPKGHSPVTDSGVKPTCINSGLTEGSHCIICGEVLVKRETIPPTGHIDKNGDYVCDVCLAVLNFIQDYEENKCNCGCHKGGFEGLIFKIINLFNRLLGKNRYCACGKRHW